jgi:hypothetical protein
VVFLRQLQECAIMSPRTISEIRASLEPLLTERFAQHGFLNNASKSEPLAFARPANDTVSLLVNVGVGGWSSNRHYLTIRIGATEPVVARTFKAAAHLGGDLQTFMLCGTFLKELDSVQQERLRQWHHADGSADTALCDDLAQAAIAGVNEYLTDCDTLAGILALLKQSDRKSELILYDHYLLKLLIPICEFRLGDTMTARRTISENVVILQSRFPHISSTDYLTRLAFITD